MKYSINKNGSNVEVYKARTSAIPFNRVWQGKQRDLSQTEISYFSTFDMDSPVVLDVEIQDCDVKSVEIRPREYNIKYEVNGSFVRIYLDYPRKFTLEVNGYHEALHIFANEVCKYTHSDDENMIYFGKGVHRPGLIVPKDNQTIFIDEGAVVHGIIYAYKAKNVSIVGRGILDASSFIRGNEAPIESDEILSAIKSLGLTDKDVQYYSMLNAYECENLLIDGIILRDAPLWTVIVRNQCKNVTINNIKLIGQWRYNSDGIDICSSSDVVVSDCFIRAFDDCVVVRGCYLDGEVGGCSNVIVKDNVLWCDWGKNLEIWCGNKDTLIENITFENNHIIRFCHNVISIDTWFGSENVSVNNVKYSNTFIDATGEMLRHVYQATEDMQYQPDLSIEPCANIVYITIGKLGKSIGNQACDESFDTSSFRISYTNISFENITVFGDRKLASLVDSSRLAEFGPIKFTSCTLGNITMK